MNAQQRRVAYRKWLRTIDRMKVLAERTDTWNRWETMFTDVSPLGHRKLVGADSRRESILLNIEDDPLRDSFNRISGDSLTPYVELVEVPNE